MLCRAAFLPLAVCLSSLPAVAAPKASMVMDARTGAIYAEYNADERLHPASLTKMMTLYIAFEAVERGEIDMDTPIRISRAAASEIPSKLGLAAGQTIALRYLVRGAAVKSANDAATAIAEGISGSEAAFADRMNRTARALGMTRTHFENAHGLTEPGHLSTARDMTILGLRLVHDYPQYFNLFSRLTADAGITEVRHTNRRFLTGYPGADGIKTGYTQAAGYNLVASAQRGQERIIATVMGSSSVSERTEAASRLMDQGFAAAPSILPIAQLGAPDYSGAVSRSPRPKARPESIQRLAEIARSQEAFSYAEMMRRRRAALGQADPAPVAEPAPVPTIHRGRFAPVVIPRPGTGRFVTAGTTPPSESQILAAATATVSELRAMAGFPVQEIRSSDADRTDPMPVEQPVQIDRMELSEFDRAVAGGTEIPMSVPEAAKSASPFAPNPIGTFSPVAHPRAGTHVDRPVLAPNVQAALARNPAPQATTAVDPSIFNISDLERPPLDVPPGSIFERAPAAMLPGALIPSSPSATPAEDDATNEVRRSAPASETSLPAIDEQAAPPAAIPEDAVDPARPEPIKLPW